MRRVLAFSAVTCAVVVAGFLALDRSDDVSVRDWYASLSRSVDSVNAASPRNVDAGNRGSRGATPSEGAAPATEAQFTQLPASTPSTARTPDRGAWRLVFSDDFNGDELNPAYWNIKHNTAADPNLSGKEDFTNAPEHVRVEGGALRLRGMPKAGGRFATGLVETRGKKSWMHGRFEARMRVARGSGTNSAFWMMPDVKSFEPWPQSGEIDIAEQLGREPTMSHGVIHFPGEVLQRDHGVFRGNQILADDFHVYALEWDRGSFEWFLDGRSFHRTSTPEMARFPFNRPFFIILMLGLGNENWAGPVTADTPVPMTLDVDWVRVYQREPRPARAQKNAVIAPAALSEK